MVNTFLICPNWILSAKILDKSRVWKQVVEARQILQLIEDLKHIINYNKYCYQNWDDLKKLISNYKNSNVIFLRKDNTYLLIDKNTYNSGNYDKTMKPVKLGFVYHPVVKMWWSFTEALKYYINVHISECLNRNFDPNIREYYCAYNSVFRGNELTTQQMNDPNFITIPSEITYPSWIYNLQLYSIHRANLKRKDANYYSLFSENPINGYNYELFYDPIFLKNNINNNNLIFCFA